MGQIRGFFRSDFSAFGAKIWKRPGFVPFGANLNHFGAKPTIPGVGWCRASSKWCLPTISRLHSPPVSHDYKNNVHLHGDSLIVSIYTRQCSHCTQRQTWEHTELFIAHYDKIESVTHNSLLWHVLSRQCVPWRVTWPWKRHRCDVSIQTDKKCTHANCQHPNS